MQLIREHLLMSGYSDTVAAMDREASNILNVSTKEYQDFQSLLNKRKLDCLDTPSESNLELKRSKLIISKNSAHLSNGFIPKRFRLQRIRAALKSNNISSDSKNIFSPISKSDGKLFKTPVAINTVVSSTKTNLNQPVTKLESIMSKYLKMQHRNCSHPVSIISKQSLVKPHCCPPLKKSSSNINDIITNKYTTGAKRYYQNWYSAQQTKRFVYSSYKTWRGYHEVVEGCSLTATSFSQQDSTKMWTASEYDHNIMLSYYDLKTRRYIQSYFNFNYKYNLIYH